MGKFFNLRIREPLKNEDEIARDYVQGELVEGHYINKLDEKPFTIPKWIQEIVLEHWKENKPFFYQDMEIKELKENPTYRIQANADGSEYISNFNSLTGDFKTLQQIRKKGEGKYFNYLKSK